MVAELEERVCPACGQRVDPWPDDDDKTPVDGRLEKFAQANIVLMEAALEQTRRELAAEQSIGKERAKEIDRLRVENGKLILELNARIQKFGR